MEHDDGVWLIAVFEQKSVYKVVVVVGNPADSLLGICAAAFTVWVASIRRRFLLALVYRAV